jgi:uncharacterized protein YraI
LVRLVRRAVASPLSLVVLAALVAAAVPAIVAAVDGPGEEPDAGARATACETCRAFSADALNLRAEPNLTADALTVIPAGTELALAGEAKDGYVPVVHDGELGWVFAAYVAPPGVTAVAGADVATATAALNLRADPTTSAEVLEVIPAGGLVVLLGEERDGFTRVAFDGLTGYASTRYLDED